MPEIIEVEYYRRLAEDRVVGRRVRGVQADDGWFLKDGTTREAIEVATIGRTVRAARRRGKLLVLDVGDSTLGLRFGMTGRLLVDGEAAIARLEYASDRNDPKWDRFALELSRPKGSRRQGLLVIRDPRRLGGVTLDPDEARLGVDAWSVTAEQLAGALSGSSVALKARLLDQSRLAGVGNLLADETLWRVGLDPRRSADSLGEHDIEVLATGLRSVIAELSVRGGSHTGDLHASRGGGPCPRDGTPLQRSDVGGRTTWWCPAHQH